MSFKKRNVAIASSDRSGASSYDAAPVKVPGIRPSPLDGRSVTSTGTSALDGLLAGHGGLALGCSLLIEESGTTDYAGALLRFCAAEGLLQGHHVHVVGLPEQWGRELPGAIDEKTKGTTDKEGGKLKIAWRYESLGQSGSSTPSRDVHSQQDQSKAMSTASLTGPIPFNHSFDLTKRLVHPSNATINFVPISSSLSTSPFAVALTKIESLCTSSPPSTVHRILLPSLLSPMLYPPHASNPQYLLPFLHSLRSLLSTYSLTMMFSLPLSLHPRSSGLTRWIELLSDGVLELAPFPHTSVATPSPSPSEPSIEEPPQGLLRIHKLPILHELGSGTRSYDDDWTFSLSRRKLSIKPFNLPPLEGDTHAQQADVQASGPEEKTGKVQKAKKEDMEF